MLKDIRRDKWTIIKPCLVVCEGADAFNFFLPFLDKHIQSGRNAWENIQVSEFGGNSGLEKCLEIVRKDSSYPTLKALLILRDAEQNAATAVSEIKRALRRMNMTTPDTVNAFSGPAPAIAYSLFPSFNAVDSGTLENLCMKLICEDCYPALSADIDAFLGQVESSHGKAFPRKHKSQLHSYFSVCDKFVGLKLGEAAKSGAYDFWKPAAQPLIALFDELAAFA